MITTEDWRQVPPDVLAPLYDAECARWYAALGWDYRPSCGLIEAARTGGRLPGLLARREGGQVAGWSYFLRNQDALQIGNVVADDEATVRALLRTILRGPEALRARRMSCFLFPGLPAVEQVLRRARFSILRHGYLQRPLAEASEAGVSTSDGALRPADGHVCLDGREYMLRDWSADLIPDVLVLLSGAYEGSREARCFAPDGEMGQWATYIHQLVQTPACGRFERGLSLIVETTDHQVAGAILVTALSARMAHIAQMAVGNVHRRRGIGELMVQVACDRAREARYEQMTLLVAESNERARRLYERLGFAASAEFVFADRVNSSQSTADKNG